jgi:hypothetical protein
VIRLCKLYNVEFHWRNKSHIDIVDVGISLSDARQVMANWYVENEEAYIACLYWHEEDYANDIDYESVYRFLAGEFIVRDGRGNITERVDADVVRASPEIDTADRAWKERRDPDYERKEKEAREVQREKIEMARIHFAHSPHFDADSPF